MLNWYAFIVLEQIKVSQDNYSDKMKVIRLLKYELYYAGSPLNTYIGTTEYLQYSTVPVPYKLTVL